MQHFAALLLAEMGATVRLCRTTRRSPCPSAKPVGRVRPSELRRTSGRKPCCFAPRAGTCGPPTRRRSPRKHARFLPETSRRQQCPSGTIELRPVRPVSDPISSLLSASCAARMSSWSSAAVDARLSGPLVILVSVGEPPPTWTTGGLKLIRLSGQMCR